ncbi:MAG: chlorophyllase/cutinase-like alpha/beta fold protein [Sciscionella sp.]
MSSSPKQLFGQLSQPGAHRVLRGDLGLVGLPGLVFTPESGLGLPAVAFGHGFLQPARRYSGLLRHLASWGIVAAAPNTQRGPLPSHRLFAADLHTTLDICTGVRLGDGEISVDRKKLGLAGHGFGGGAAVLAAAEDERVRAVAGVAPAESLPSAVPAAARCAMPGLLLAGEADRMAPLAGHARPIARAWQGQVQLRVVGKASHLGFAEGRHLSELLLDGKAQRRSQRVAKALLTAFFLKQLTGSGDYDELLDSDVKAAAIEELGEHQRVAA